MYNSICTHNYRGGTKKYLTLSSMDTGSRTRYVVGVVSEPSGKFIAKFYEGYSFIDSSKIYKQKVIDLDELGAL